MQIVDLLQPRRRSTPLLARPLRSKSIRQIPNNQLVVMNTCVKYLRIILSPVRNSRRIRIPSQDMTCER